MQDITVLVFLDMSIFPSRFGPMNLRLSDLSQSFQIVSSKDFLGHYVLSELDLKFAIYGLFALFTEFNFLR